MHTFLSHFTFASLHLAHAIRFAELFSVVAAITREWMQVGRPDVAL